MPPSAPTTRPSADPAYQRHLERVQRALNVAGYAILLAGTLSAAWVYTTAKEDKASEAIMAAEQNTKQYEYQMEVLGGKTNLLGNDMRQWFLAQWHGRHLADTLAVLTFVLALGCFFVAHFVPDFPPPHDPGSDAAAPRRP